VESEIDDLSASSRRKGFIFSAFLRVLFNEIVLFSVTHPMGGT
jgi:hypothetical protein